MRNVASEIDARLSRSAADGRFSGAVLVAEGNETILEGAYGQADRVAGLPITTSTRFRIGSLNKMFTAVAVLQLEARGQLDLDRPVGTWLPNYPSAAFAGSVTLQQLLTHTAGAGNVFGPEFEAHRLSLVQISDYICLFGPRDPEFQPGAKFAYSNYGYVVLGAVIEAVTGMSYYRYVREHIFTPLGMGQTESPLEHEAPAGAAIGYMRTAEGLQPNTPTLPARGTPAGGGLSTVGDLHRFARALQAKQLFDPEATRRLIIGRVEMMPAMKYGYGFIEWEQGRTRTFGNMGSAPGMSAVFQAGPDDGRVLVILSNRDPPIAQTVQEMVAKHLSADH